MGRSRLLIATRGSPLALWQARKVAQLLLETGQSFEVDLIEVRTRGDELGSTPIDLLAGQGVFVKEVQVAVLQKRADIAVHSAKDLPSAPCPGLVLACVPVRSDPRDAMVGSPLGSLVPGAVVATGSARRRAQLAWARPDLTFADLRGNMARRVEQARSIGAGVVAMAALDRLGICEVAAEVLEPSVMLPQVGQGSIAVECREDDEDVIGLLDLIDDPRAHRELVAERAFLAAVGGGCTAPLAALARSGPCEEPMVIEGLIAARDGSCLVRSRRSGSDAEVLGRELAEELLVDCGGLTLLDWGADSVLASSTSFSGPDPLEAVSRPEAVSPSGSVSADG